MHLSPLIIAILCATAYAAIHEEYIVPHNEESLGPVIRTGRYRLVQERIIGTKHDAQNTELLKRERRPYGREEHPDRSYMQGREEEVPANAARFTYNGPNDGRQVYIYRRVHTPVRIRNGVIERLGPAQTVERWAEGGYQAAQNHNIEVYHRVGHEVIADKAVPVKNGFLDEQKVL